MGTLSRQIIFTVVSAILVVIVLEVTLKILAQISPRVDWLLSAPWAPAKVPDEHLGHRPAPGFPGHDRNGWRNPQVPERVDVVTLGDSQTYGTGVKPQDAWPRQLEYSTSKTTYSMAHGGYGPVHSLLLWDEAVTLEPTIIIEAFYAGNDLHDTYNIVYNRGQHVELKTEDPDVHTQIHDLEELESIAEYVGRMYRMEIVDKQQKQNTSAITPLRFLSQHSEIYGLLRRLKYELSRLLVTPENSSEDEVWKRSMAHAEKYSEYTEIFNNGQFRTIFTPEYRLAATNLADARIAEGKIIALRAISKMNELANERNIRFIVLLIPTKELVFQLLMESPSNSYTSLIDNENALWVSTRSFLDRNEIEYIDSLPALREQLDSGIQPYQVSRDGHPNKYGHEAIANLVNTYLGNL